MPLTWLLDRLARSAGYVRESTLVEAVKAVVIEKDRLEEELRRKNRTLQLNINLRDRLETEVEFMRQLELSHARQDSGIEQAVAKLDAVANKTLELLRSVWPEVYGFDPAQVDQEVVRAEV